MDTGMILLNPIVLSDRTATLQDVFDLTDLVWSVVLSLHYNSSKLDYHEFVNSVLTKEKDQEALYSACEALYRDIALLPTHETLRVYARCNMILEIVLSDNHTLIKI